MMHVSVQNTEFEVEPGSRSFLAHDIGQPLITAIAS
jgi:hypothetical protein